MALSLSLAVNTAHAELKQMFKLTNKNGISILIIGETHSEYSRDQFKDLFDKKIIDGTEKDFFYLLELPADFSLYLNPGRGLIGYVCKSHWDPIDKIGIKSDFIDYNFEHTALNLSYPLNNLFENDASIEIINEFFTKLGTYTEEEIPDTGIFNNNTAICMNLMEYKKAIEDAIKERAHDKCLKIIAEFHNDWYSLIDITLALQITPNGLKNRNQCMAKAIAKCKSKKNVICVVGSAHLEPIRKLLIDKHEIKAVTEIETCEDVLKKEKQIFVSN